MAHYINLTLPTVERFFASRRFERDTVNREVVYRRTHERYPGLVMTVYTSLADGAEAARTVGADAIRVTLTLKTGDRERGVKSFARVYRVTSEESTLARMLARILEAAAYVNRELTPCVRCSGPAYADSRRCLGHCAAISMGARAARL